MMQPGRAGAAGAAPEEEQHGGGFGGGGQGQQGEQQEPPPPHPPQRALLAERERDPPALQHLQAQPQFTAFSLSDRNAGRRNSSSNINNSTSTNSSSSSSSSSAGLRDVAGRDRVRYGASAVAGRAAALSGSSASSLGPLGGWGAPSEPPREPSPVGSDGAPPPLAASAFQSDPSEGEAVDVVTFGQNHYGELAHGDILERKVPEIVRFVRQLRLRPKQVVAGNEHTAVLCEDGQVYCCGYNDSGQCGVGHQVRVHRLQLVEGLRDARIAQIHSANGSEHMLAVSTSGTLFVWGYNSRGQLGLGTTQNSFVPRINEALRSRRVAKVACSYYHTLLSTEGPEEELWAFGRNDYGQLGVDDNLDRSSPERVVGLPRGAVLSLACGQYHSVFSIEGQGLHSCGKNDYGQLGQLSAAQTGSEPRLVPQPVAAPLDAAAGVSGVQVACGYYHSVALTEQGQVFCFGRNDFGQLGLGSKDNKKVPTRLEGLPLIAQISSGCYHTLLLTEEGQVLAQGRNNHGQLGTAHEGDATVPVKVDALHEHRVLSLAAGFYHSACLVGPPAPAVQLPGSLSRDLRGMLNNPQRSDVEFIVEGRRIYAHRCIIIARCEPLNKMLDGPMREAHMKEIEMPGLQYHVMLAVLEFIYTDEVRQLEQPRQAPVDIDFCLDLLQAADLFLVARLKRLAEDAITESMSVANVCAMLRTADARQAAPLRKRCFDFVLKNFGKVIGTEGFAALPHELLREVCLAAHDKGVSIRR